jgi:hypothetical protein
LLQIADFRQVVVDYAAALQLGVNARDCCLAGQRGALGDARRQSASCSGLVKNSTGPGSAHDGIARCAGMTVSAGSQAGAGWLKERS